jgi:hypothetical protein
MADIEFSSAELTALAAKLDQLGARLNERERAILIATFQMAGDQLSELGSGAGAGGNLESVGFAAPSKLPTLKISNVEALPSLSAGFRDSFTRGPAAGGLGSRAAVEWDASVSVMGGGM